MFHPQRLRHDTKLILQQHKFTYLCTATDLTHRFASTMQTSVPMQAAHISAYTYLHIDQNQLPEPLRGSAPGFILLLHIAFLF